VSNARFLVVCIYVLLGTGCTSTTYSYQSDDEMTRTLEQPLRDLGWMREDPPEILKQVEAAPYALGPDWTCERLLVELSDLGVVLGPDLDFPTLDGTPPVVDAEQVMTNAVGGLWSLPYRGIIRWITGATERDRVLRNAILAGTVRRAFLRGVILAVPCLPPPTTTEPGPETALIEPEIR
jgi:hypothetical protein